MNIRKLNPISDAQVERKSSIYQHKNVLSVMVKGEWCPITFDHIDKVNCDGSVESHKIAIKLSPSIDYTFPVGTCKYVKDTYYLTQKDKTELRPLPEYYGAGFYQTHERKDMITNIGKDAFGHHEEKILRVGKDYCVAKTILDPVE